MANLFQYGTLIRVCVTEHDQALVKQILTELKVPFHEWTKHGHNNGKTMWAFTSVGNLSKDDIGVINRAINAKLNGGN